LFKIEQILRDLCGGGIPMELSQKTFEVLDTLDRQPIMNQRQLARHAGVSLGQANYILKSLLDKGLVKASNFRKSRRKIGYAYLLTPRGIQAKSRLAVRFITSKLEEYDSLRNRLAEKLTSIESRNARQIAFVGPQVVRSFVESIINEQDLKLEVTVHFRDWKDLREISTGAYDLVLLFDDVRGGVNKVAESLSISRDKFVPLW
jgi:EPS-associated MarR family transcriptional regulator